MMLLNAFDPFLETWPKADAVMTPIFGSTQDASDGDGLYGINYESPLLS